MGTSFILKKSIFLTIIAYYGYKDTRNPITLSKLQERFELHQATLYDYLDKLHNKKLLLKRGKRRNAIFHPNFDLIINNFFKEHQKQIQELKSERDFLLSKYNKDYLSKYFPTYYLESDFEPLSPSDFPNKESVWEFIRYPIRVLNQSPEKFSFVPDLHIIPFVFITTLKGLELQSYLDYYLELCKLKEPKVVELAKIITFCDSLFGTKEYLKIK